MPRPHAVTSLMWQPHLKMAHSSSNLSRKYSGSRERRGKERRLTIEHGTTSAARTPVSSHGPAYPRPPATAPQCAAACCWAPPPGSSPTCASGALTQRQRPVKLRRLPTLPADLAPCPAQEQGRAGTFVLAEGDLGEVSPRVH
eukprot:scaffold20950_cov151-Isochrysis_galbana.AAC.4